MSHGDETSHSRQSWRTPRLGRYNTHDKGSAKHACQADGADSLQRRLALVLLQGTSLDVEFHDRASVADAHSAPHQHHL